MSNVREAATTKCYLCVAVEKLASSLPSETQLTSPKDVYFCAIDSLDELPSEIESLSPHFGLFLAVDAANIQKQNLGETASKLVARGLVYLVAWGPGCGDVEDAFDFAYIGRQLDGENFVPASPPDVLMTTSHPDEPLSDALWFFLNCTEATKGFVATCRDWVAVGNHVWADEIKRQIVKRVETLSK